jgi:dTMP kinase
VSEQAPFIPSAPDAEPIPSAPWRVFRVPGFPRLFGAQAVSSLGDWTGLLAILAVASRVSNSGTAVGLVMVARMLPGFILAPVGGALVDRWNRRAVMVTCDIGRAGLLVALPFWDTLVGLVVISFSIEVLTLLWGPAKDASVPNVVKDPDQLASANSLGLVAAFGTFPLGAVMFAILAGVAKWLGHFDALSALEVNQESLAIWIDGGTFLVSALLISGLRLDESERSQIKRAPVSQTWHDIVAGMNFIRSNAMVRGVMIGLAGGLVGGGAIVPLGPVFAREVLGGGASTFGLLMVAFGVGASIGVVTLLAFQRRLPRDRVFIAAVAATGIAIIAVAWMWSLTLALVLVAVVGAGAGCGYVTGFTLLQESVADEMRGRTFATLYAVVRLCLLLSLTVGPFVATGLGALSKDLVDTDLEIGTVTVSLPGVRLALLLGGLITVFSAIMARRRMRKATRVETDAA